jgi:phage terminase large subunit
MEIQILQKFIPLIRPKRFKIAYGGRGGGRSWNIARILLLKGIEKPLLILCTRQYQVSINNSVYRLLVEQIGRMGLYQHYYISKSQILGYNGTRFIFRGLQNPVEIKSLEGVDICWVEEAENVTADSWDYLIPTIRKEGSEIWISFNPDSEDGETYKRFIKNFDPVTMCRVYTTYKDNPFIAKLIIEQAERDKRNDIEKYEWIWLGKPRKHNEAQVFKGKWEVQRFASPKGIRYFYGVDWGFANDPTVLIRCFVQDEKLYIDYEAYGTGVELDELRELFSVVPMEAAVIYADPSRPETISYLKKQGLNIYPADSWKNSVQDGIEFLKSFQKIVIHERCQHAINEFRNYSYKVDSKTNEVLPILIDAYNHCIDALRYAICKLIKSEKEPKIRML